MPPVRVTGAEAAEAGSQSPDVLQPGDNAVVPRHIAVIMDGNGRWAKARGLPRFAGHRAGVESVRRLVAAATARKIGVLTIYSFSTENWSRPPEEVSELMRLLKLFIRADLAKLHQQNVRIKIIGERDGLSTDLVSMLDEAESLTHANSGLNLVVAFNYGARQEMLRAMRRVAADIAAGALNAGALTLDEIEKRLDTAGLPDPDLIIRTSGEQRISNFLLWQAAYAEFVFMPVLWPDFGEAELDQAIEAFRQRHRRFGGL